MRLPDVAARLTELAVEIAMLSEQIKRRRRVKVAPPAARRMTKELAAQIRQYAKEHPTWTQMQIAKKFGVNPGRVSEAIRGKRK